jgi:DNA-binding transcriptional LysR family regulator
MKPAPSFEDLRVFVLVAQLGNFTRVAQHLQTAPSAVSMAIGRLEAQLGARLFQRTTRTVVPTDEGMALLARAERVLEDVDEMSALFQQADSPLSGRLRVDMPLGMAAGIVMQMLPQFLAHHPELELEVCSTDRRVDVIADGFDCVVRVGTVVDETLVCRPLGLLALCNVASPAYIAEHGAPRDLPALAAHYIVNYAPNASTHNAQFDYLDGALPRSIAMRHRITVNNSASCGAACRAGFGIAQLPLFSVEGHLASGALVQLLPRHVPAPMAINLLYPHRRNVPRRVRVFGDWLADVLAASMAADSAESGAGKNLL